MPQAGIAEWCCVWPFVATSMCRGRRPVVIALLGLDSAGKSTILSRKLRKEQCTTVLPTCGFACKTWKVQDFSVFVFDLGGRKGIRNLWRHCFAEAFAAIFVIDSTDKSRFPEAKSELESAVNNPYLLEKPILVVANKQGFASAMSFEDIRFALRRLESSHNLVQCKCDLQEGSVFDADFEDGLQWLLETISIHYKELQQRVKRETLEQRLQERRQREDRRERIKLAKLRDYVEIEAAENNLQSERSVKGEDNVQDLLDELKHGKGMEFCLSSETMLLPGQILRH